MILTSEVVGIEDSEVLLLLVLIVDELVLVSEFESLPVDVRLAEESEVDALRSADEVKGPEAMTPPRLKLLRSNFRKSRSMKRYLEQGP